MSDIRKEFYEAINKSNLQKPKKTIKKFAVRESISVEDQIKNILNESELAIIKDEVIINNQPLVDYLYNLTKKDEETLELEKRINQELEILNKLRDEARSKYNRFNRMNEVSTINTSAAAASSSAAGAGAGSGAGGGGRIIIKTDPSTNSYVVDNYIDNYLQ
jgi:hypothetical protein